MFIFLSIKSKGQSLWTVYIERKLTVEHIKTFYQIIIIGMHTKATVKCQFIAVIIIKLEL